MKRLLLFLIFVLCPLSSVIAAGTRGLVTDKTTGELKFADPSNEAQFIDLAPGQFKFNHTTINFGNGANMVPVADSSGNLWTTAAIVVDSAGANNGSVASKSINFAGGLEGIVSKRTSGGNQYGIDIITNNLSRLSFANNGDITAHNPISGTGFTMGGSSTVINAYSNNGGVPVTTLNMETGPSVGGALSQQRLRHLTLTSNPSMLLYSTINYGSPTVAPLGSTGGFMVSQYVENSAGNGNEYASYFTTINFLRDDNGERNAPFPTAVPGRVWTTDFSLLGPVQKRPGMLGGIIMAMANYYNGSPTGQFSDMGDALDFPPDYGGPPQNVYWSPDDPVWNGTTGGTNTPSYAFAAASTAGPAQSAFFPSFPVDVGLHVVGVSMATPNRGFNYGIVVGGTGSNWKVPSRTKTAVWLGDYDTYGLVLARPYSGTTPTAALFTKTGAGIASIMDGLNAGGIAAPGAGKITLGSSTNDLSGSLAAVTKLFIRGDYITGGTDAIYSALQVGLNGDPAYGATLSARRDVSNNTHAILGVRNGGGNVGGIDVWPSGGVTIGSSGTSTIDPGSTNLVVTGNLTATNISATGPLVTRISGTTTASTLYPLSGAGLDLLYETDFTVNGIVGTAFVQSYDHSANVYKALFLSGDQIGLGANLVFIPPGAGLNVGGFSDPGAGVVNAATGFRIANTAATSGNVLRGNGTNFISAQLAGTDLSVSATARLLGRATSGAGNAEEITIGSGLAIVSGALTGNTGTVTTFSAGNLSPIFTASVATATTTPALSFSLNAQNANKVFAGPSTGSDAAPTFRLLVPADIPSLDAGKITTGTFGNTMLTNSAVTIGSTSVSLGATVSTLAGVTLTAPAINGGTHTAITGLALRDTSAAFDVTIAAASGTTLTAGRTLTLDMGNAAHTLIFGAASTLTFPTGTRTIASLDGTEELTSKTLNAAVAKGTWTVSGTWTLPSVTLSGTISGGPVWASSQAITLSTAAQPNVTSLGTLTGLTVGSFAQLTRGSKDLYINPNYALGNAYGFVGMIDGQSMGLAVSSSDAHPEWFMVGPTGGISVGSINDHGAGTITLVNRSTPATGNGTMYYDGTHFYGYTGGAWKQLDN